MGTGEPRWVLVTGATSGIGQACVLALLAQGFQVLGGFRKKSDAARLRALGVVPVQLDVTRSGTLTAAAAATRKRCGKRGLHGLVNNAGVTLCAPLELVPLAQLRQLLEVNVVGVIAVTQVMLPLLRAARGRVVNVGSLNGLVAAPFLGPYAASKAALESLSDALRMELAPWGIEVSVIEPASTASRIWDKAAASTRSLRTRVPRATLRLYAAAWDRFDEVIRNAAHHAVPAQTVAAAVVDALTADAPSTRYPLDQGQSLQLRALADRERDATLLRAFGLSGGGR